MSANLLLKKRDAKVKPHLEQYAPVWLIDEVVIAEDEAVQFNVIFQHNLYGWVSRRYRYDAFNDVLYYHGQRRLSEEDALAMQDEPPYIPAESINTVESYGG